MIASLSGAISEISDGFVIMETSAGVGYQVFTPSVVLAQLEIGSETRLFTVMLVSNDNNIVLYGFLDKVWVKLFRMLLSVNGIGPRSALACLDRLTPEKITEGIANQDASVFAKVPGIGKKTAQRIITDLADKTDAVLTAASSNNPNLLEAQNGLVYLGYSQTEAMRLVMAVNEPGKSAEEIIRAALKKVVKS